MKIHPNPSTVQSIGSYGDGWIQVGSQKLTHSVVLSSRGEQINWQCDRFEDLTTQHFEQLAQLQTELVIFGSGTRLRFASLALTRPLIDQQIGLETMDTGAACRTYNLLVNEARLVACALLMR